VEHERTPEKGTVERDEEQARNISRALSGREKEWKGECGSGVRQNLNPFNGDKSLSARDPLRRTGRQFVRVYPTHPDISTSRPGVARVANHPLTFLTSFTHLLFLLFHLHSILPFFDYSLIFFLSYVFFFSPTFFLFILLFILFFLFSILSFVILIFLVFFLFLFFLIPFLASFLSI